MNALLYLAHILGFTIWLGGGLASMVVGVRARQMDRQILGAATRMLAAVHQKLMVPGVILVVLSGVYLSFPASQAGSPSAWLMVMQGAGMLAAILLLFVAGPAINRLARTEPTGDTAALFDLLRKRHVIASSISGTLGLLSLVAGVLLKF